MLIFSVFLAEDWAIKEEKQSIDVMVWNYSKFFASLL